MSGVVMALCIFNFLYIHAKVKHEDLNNIKRSEVLKSFFLENAHFKRTI
jgi:hypothetical protein